MYPERSQMYPERGRRDRERGQRDNVSGQRDRERIKNDSEAKQSAPEPKRMPSVAGSHPVGGGYVHPQGPLCVVCVIGMCMYQMIKQNAIETSA